MEDVEKEVEKEEAAPSYKNETFFIINETFFLLSLKYKNNNVRHTK